MPAPAADKAKAPDAPPTAAVGVKTAAATPAAAAASGTPLQQLWAAAQASGHPEIWGVTLADPGAHVPTQIVLQKYLNANDGDVARARDQLTKTLEWRAKTRPLDLVARAFNRTKFGGLGYVTDYAAPGADVLAEPDRREVFTWNIYGGVKDIEETFGVLDEQVSLPSRLPYSALSLSPWR